MPLLLPPLRRLGDPPSEEDDGPALKALVDDTDRSGTKGFRPEAAPALPPPPPSAPPRPLTTAGAEKVRGWGRGVGVRGVGGWERGSEGEGEGWQGVEDDGGAGGMVRGWGWGAGMEDGVG